MTLSSVTKSISAHQPTKRNVLKSLLVKGVLNGRMRIIISQVCAWNYAYIMKACIINKPESRKSKNSFICVPIRYFNNKLKSRLGNFKLSCVLSGLPSESSLKDSIAVGKSLDHKTLK